MGRRHQRHSKRRRNQQHSTTNENDEPMLSLEEDLKRQRIRQQERQQQQQQELHQDIQEEAMEEREDHFFVPSSAAAPYDPRRDFLTNPLPSYYNSTTSDETLGNRSGSSINQLLRLREKSPLVSRAQRQKHLCAAHADWLRRELRITPSATKRFFDGTSKRHDCHLPDNRYAPWDLECKSRLHPAARTLDVSVTWNDPIPVQGFMLMPLAYQMELENPDSIYHPSATTVVASIAQAGWAVHSCKLENRQGRAWQRGNGISSHFESPSAHCIRLDQRSRRCGLLTASAGSNGNSSFQLSNLCNLICQHSMELHRPVNDFCFGQDLALFACNRFAHNSTSGGRRGAQYNPLFLPLEYMSVDIENYGPDNLRSLDVQNFPQSDALKVEKLCGQATSDKLVAFGHRNGQASLLDLRQSNSVCDILQYPNEIGSVTNMEFLEEHHQLLVRRSFASCQLHDLRKTSCSGILASEPAHRNNQNHRPKNTRSTSSALLNMTVPSNVLCLGNDGPNACSTLSANCTGMALDPTTRRILFSPFMDHRKQPQLGLWSLQTGTMLSSTRLAPDTENDRSTNSTPSTSCDGDDPWFVELCQQTAPALPKKNDDGTSSLTSFGMWMKCGRFTNGSNPQGNYGSLRQVTIPGNVLDGDLVLNAEEINRTLREFFV